jgi:glutamate N-acetyltransferase/amino-acid N-acetyltransferase
MRNAVASAAAVASELKISEDRILVASTGVIGEQLRVDKIKRAVPELIRNLSSDGFSDFAHAIMTTDTTAKIVSRQGQLGEKTFTVLGVAKGSGMIRPDMATMLCFVCTDLKIAPDVLKETIVSATEHSFNKITVDGDMSTNDTVIVLANGACGATVEKSSEKSAFQDVLDDVLFELAKMIVRDGEGATRLVEIVVKNASSDEDAKAAADAVANSLLVKTALFGEDANWGRIMAALGRSGAKVVPEKVDVYFDQIRLVQNGLLSSAYLEKDAERILKQNEYVISMDLKLGNGSASVFTCDLSVDYVKINADYRS